MTTIIVLKTLLGAGLGFGMSMMFRHFGSA